MKNVVSFVASHNQYSPNRLIQRGRSVGLLWWPKWGAPKQRFHFVSGFDKRTTTSIYVGEDRVIQFTAKGKVGTGTSKVRSILRARSRVPCPNCTPPDEGNLVISSCLNCFLAGGFLYRYEYGVTPAFFLAKTRGGTCTLADADPNDVVVYRARELLNHGFGRYNLCKKNCEDFAIYCKTGLLVKDKGIIGQSNQVICAIGFPLAVATLMSTPLGLVTANVYGMTAAYYVTRYVTDISMRKDVVKVPLEDLTGKSAAGLPPQHCRKS